MAKAAKTVLSLMTLCAAGGASVWIAAQARDMAEHRTEQAVDRALSSAGYDWVTVVADGLTATLSGTAPDEAARVSAMAAAGGAINPANLDDAMTLAEAPEMAPDFRLEILRSGRDVTLMGVVPGQAGSDVTLAGRVAPDLSVAQMITTSPAAAPEGWTDAVDAALAAVTALPDSRVVLTPGSLAITGLAETPDDADALRRRLDRVVPQSVALDLGLRTPRPVAAPFVTGFRLGSDGAALTTCVAHSHDGRSAIREAALAAGAEPLSDSCTLAAGAPAEDWDDVVARSIAALSAIGDGILRVSDLSVTITPGEGAGDIAAAAEALRSDLPPAYTLTMVQPETEPETKVSPGLTATRARDGTTTISGTVADGAGLVSNLAAARFDRGALSLDLTAQPDLNDDWTLRALTGLDAFAALDTGDLSVTSGRIRITGQSGDPAMEVKLAGRLSDLLGPQAAVDLDIAYAAEFDPTAAMPTPEVCIARIAAVQKAQKITFEPGSDTLDSDALGTVSRIAGILSECGPIGLQISGHTDSQGRATMNRELSRARADAVYRGLIAERILPSTLTATGFGEQRPISDNDTEAGREANRRIEFTLRRPLLGPPAPGDMRAAGMTSMGEQADGGQ